MFHSVCNRSCNVLVLIDFIDFVINESGSFRCEWRYDGGLWPSHNNSDAATIFLKSGKFNLLDPRTQGI